jgi:hypothetical protein
METYRSSVPDWATQLELVVHEPQTTQVQQVEFQIDPEYEPLFLVSVVTMPSGQFPPFLDAQLNLTQPQGYLVPVASTAAQYVAQSPTRLIVIDRPARGTWKISASGTDFPYAVTTMVFHPAIPQSSAPSPGTTAASPFKCRACKTTAKALALAIVAAATLQAFPAALIAAVAHFLGATAIVATAFISAVIKDTVDVIAEKLCRWVLLCP